MKTQINLGYSIEFEYEISDLELVGKYEGLPLYKVIGGQVTAIALVEKPANQTNCIADRNENTVAGVVLIPDQKIFRDEPEICYWYFPSETIRKLQQNCKNNQLKIGHTTKLKKINFTEISFEPRKGLGHIDLNNLEENKTVKNKTVEGNNDIVKDKKPTSNNTED